MANFPPPPTDEKSTAKRRKELLSAQDVADITGLSRASVYNLLNRSDMPVVQIGTRKFMHKELFIEWIREQAQAHMASKVQKEE